MGSKQVYRARRSCATTIISVIVVVQLVSGCGAKSGVAMAQAQGQSSKLPNVILEAEPRYLLGFPMLVALTYDNSGSATQYLRLPELTYWTASGAFRLSFEPVGTGGVPLVTKATPLEMDEKGMVLNPGEVARMPLDLSNFVTG